MATLVRNGVAALRLTGERAPAEGSLSRLPGAQSRNEVALRVRPVDAIAMARRSR